jgi:Ca2+/Na+ antiporter
MRKNEYIVVSILFIIFVAAIVIFLFFTHSIDIGQIMNLIILFALVCVTGIYAKRTAEIADATKKQAEEIKAQRYSECLPVLLVSIAQKTKGLDPDEHLYKILQTGSGATFEWANSGKGVAINVLFLLWGVPLDSHPEKVLFFPPREPEALEVGTHVKIDFNYKGEWFDKPAAYSPRLEAQYQDIYERKITTVQEFRIDKQNEKASLGGLYFTINGKRLGSEVIQHD